MKRARHGCGAAWHQIASRTGHCCACHRTFSNETNFDAHRHDGICEDPATLLDKSQQPRFETFTDPVGCVVWRSTQRDTRWAKP